jgi:hypothetical protein
LAQNFCTSAAQAVRVFSRASDFAVVAEPAPLAASAPAGALAGGSSARTTATRAPSLRREKPVVTTRSDAAMPLVTTAVVSVCKPTVMSRRATRCSSWTT